MNDDHEGNFYHGLFWGTLAACVLWAAILY